MKNDVRICHFRWYLFLKSGVCIVAYIVCFDSPAWVTFNPGLGDITHRRHTQVTGSESMAFLGVRSHNKLVIYS